MRPRYAGAGDENPPFYVPARDSALSLDDSVLLRKVVSTSASNTRNTGLAGGRRSLSAGPRRRRRRRRRRKRVRQMPALVALVALCVQLDVTRSRAKHVLVVAKQVVRVR